MKRHAWMGVLVVAAMSAGCGANYHVNELIKPDTRFGKSVLLIGSTESLLKSGQIDVARTMEMSDGTPIASWVIKSKTDSSRGTYVLLHGLRSSKANHLGAGKHLARKGYNVVLIDLRTHGESGGKYVTYGYKEKNDVKTVMDRLSADGVVGTPFYVFGETLGATTAIQWAAMDSRVKAVAVDAPYKNFVTHAARTHLLMNKTDLQKVIEKAEEMADFQAEEASSVKSARKLSVPLLVMNGFLNTSVPVEHAKAVYEASGGPVEMRVAFLDRTSGWLASELDELAREGVDPDDDDEPDED
ncbi:MAG: alpha/beta hydrolase [Phycisphaerae bacterium]